MAGDRLTVRIMHKFVNTIVDDILTGLSDGEPLVGTSAEDGYAITKLENQYPQGIFLGLSVTNIEDNSSFNSNIYLPSSTSDSLGIQNINLDSLGVENSINTIFGTPPSF